MMKGFITYSLLLFTLFSFAQAKKGKDNNLPKGNDDFMSRDYVDAEANYRISQSQSPTKAAASYNLGNAIYRQKQTGEAAYAYANAIKNARSKQQKHLAYHNMGNVLMKDKNYQAAVEAYKNALRNNPGDDETRYNYALAKKMLKDNPPPPPPKDDKKKDDKKKDDKNQPPKDPKGDNKDKGDKGNNKDKGGKGDNKDKGDKGDNKDKGDKGDNKDKGGEGDNKDKGGNDKGKPKPDPGPSPSKQRMDNLLDAMNNEEKKVQDKIQAKKVKVSPNKQEKDW
jgi:hypothetical protein